MLRLWKSVRAALQTTSPRRHSPRLQLEELEDRRLLSGSTPDVTYHNGPLLQNVQIQNVYYGQPWTNTTSLESTITQTDAFLQYFVTSPYMAVLSQYNVGNGTFNNQDDVVNQNPTGQTIDDSAIRQILNGEITAGHLAAPTANSLYVFYTAPGVAVTANGQNSNSDFSGYHDVFTDTAGTAVYYAVLPYPTGGSGVQLTAFQQETITLSHEVAEAITDPDTQTGWFDARYGEIADIANGQSGLLNGYTVSEVWSQSAGTVVLPSATSTTSAGSTNLQVSGVRVQATAGQPFTSIVATLTDLPAGATTSSYTATIDWGNSTTTAGTLTTDPNGGFDITGTNTYSTAGAFPITVTVDDQNGNVVGETLTTANVAAASPTITATGTQLSATAGQGFSGTVATFTDSTTGAVAGNYTATINWGDGTTSTGTVASGSVSTFDVAGSHTYTTAAPSGWGFPYDAGFFGLQENVSGTQYFVVSVVIHDTPTNTDATALSLATVVPPPVVIMATGENVAAISGQSFTGVVASFTDTNTSAAVGDFTAIINWGNGSSSVGTVKVDPNGGFEVVGTNTYNDATYWYGFGHGSRSFPISVTIADTKTEDKAATTSTATVAPTAQNLTVAAQNIDATIGQPFSGVVATFSDVNSTLVQGDFTATIHWGDGTTSTGTVTADANGGFDVSGSHTYTSTSTPNSFGGWGFDSNNGGLPYGPGSGSLPITVTVASTVNSDTGTSEASATIAPAVANVQTSSTLINAVFGTSFSGVVATFTTPLTGASWTATINWGDGTTSTGTVTQTTGGYQITGTHTYGSGGPLDLSHGGPSVGASGPQPFLVNVTITDTANNSTATAVSLASVTTVPPIVAASGVNLNLNTSTAFTGTVASFTDSDSAGTGSFKVTINWGDGTSSAGTVTVNPAGGFLVGGTHTYNRGGTYPIFVTIQDAASNKAVTLSTAIVGDSTQLGLLNTVAIDFLQSVECYTDLILKDYEQFLGRSASSSEVSYWVQAMQNGATDTQVAAGFLSSGEFFGDAGHSNKSWVDALYRDLLGRNADSAGESYWLQQLASGASLTNIALGIETSQEGESEVVQSDYQQYLGRDASAAEATYWVSSFEHGMTNDQIAASFLSSQEYFQDQHGNATNWISSAYQNVLSRKPDANGSNYWLGVLGQ